MGVGELSPCLPGNILLGVRALLHVLPLLLPEQHWSHKGWEAGPGLP